MENNIKVINNAGKDLSIKVRNAGGVIEVVVGYPESRVKLSCLKPGDIFKAGGVGYIVLEQPGNGTVTVIRKEPLKEMEFDFDSNNWKAGNARRFLNSEYLDSLVEAFGEGSIVSHSTSLMSMDGLKDYGACTDKVSLLDIRQYWRYRESIGDTLYDSDGEDGSWWLATPDSTPSGFGGNDMLYVGSMGDIGCAPCFFRKGIRPCFVLKSFVMVAADGHVAGADGASGR